MFSRVPQRSLALDWSERERTDTRVCGHGGIKAREDIREDIFSGLSLSLRGSEKREAVGLNPLRPYPSEHR